MRMLARVRDERLFGMPARLTWIERAWVLAASASGPGRFNCAWGALIGAGFAAYLWHDSPSGVGSLCGWYWSVSLAALTSLPAALVANLPFEVLLAAVREGALEDASQAQKPALAQSHEEGDARSDELTPREQRRLGRNSRWDAAALAASTGLAAAGALVAVADTLGRSTGLVYVMDFAFAWSAGYFLSEALVRKLLAKLGRRLGYVVERSQPPLSPGELLVVRNARTELTAASILPAGGLLLASFLLFSPLARGILSHWDAGLAGIAANIVGGILAGREIGERIVARLREDRRMGRLVTFTWFPRISQIAPGQEVQRNGSSFLWMLALVVLVGAASLWDSDPVPLRGWLGALIQASVVGVPFALGGMVSWQRIIRELEEGPLKGLDGLNGLGGFDGRPRKSAV